ncbi:hypothetical protein [Opitutus sp. GAS368]|uniref:hypothetical protein n=1 Tax=Opitutus sp. GAS368 TaxID=1882749 RepID=UPI0018D41698|nr:hypothetical protein [Opitutus sp. GAS368]
MNLSSHPQVVTEELGLIPEPGDRRSLRQCVPSPRARTMALLLLPLALGVLPVLPAQEVEAPYPNMAPIEQYLGADRSAEIALARSAAPEAISRDATVLVLGRNGYETVIEGKNGFTCLVERSWMSPFDSPEFWNPKIRGPICYNPAAVRSILPYTLNRTKLVLAGVSKAEMHQRIAAAVAKGELPVPAPGAMSYMMAKDGYLSDAGVHWHPHLMFHIPTTDAATWGANQPGSPVVYNNGATDMPEPETIFFVPVGRWSDGSVPQLKQTICGN